MSTNGTGKSGPAARAAAAWGAGRKGAGSVVTFGVFDGVHRGHQALLGEVTKAARVAGSAAVAITFAPHPFTLHRPSQIPELLCSLDDRVELLQAQGLDEVVVANYSPEFAAQSAAEFVANVLVGQLDARTVVLGTDARFGAGNVGDLELLRSLGAEHGFEVIAVDGVSDRPDAPRWSSSAVRAALAAGDVAAARRILGRNHFVRGVVVSGDRRGRTLGFPTANLGPTRDEPILGIVPADGVYAGYVTVAPTAPRHSGQRLPAAISIGSNPTFTGASRRIEAYVLDRTDLQLYGLDVQFEFVDRIRSTEKFDSVPDLIEAMHRDVDAARRILSDGREAKGAS